MRAQLAAFCDAMFLELGDKPPVMDADGVDRILDEDGMGHTGRLDQGGGAFNLWRADNNVRRVDADVQHHNPCRV